MDEFDVLVIHRPDPAPPTEAERAEIRAALDLVMASTTDDTSPVSVAPIAARARRRRHVRYAGVAAVAAAVALLTVVLAPSDGSGPLSTETAAADQLRQVADQLAASPYPDLPYAQVVRTDGPGFADLPLGFGLGVGVESVDVTAYTLGQGDVVIDFENCVANTADGPLPTCDVMVASSTIGDPGIALVETPDEVRQVVADRVNALMRLPGSVRSTATLQTLTNALSTPGASPAVRAELLRMLAETEDLIMTPGVANAFGDVGTSFTAELPSGTFGTVIDPDDGFVLAVTTTTPDIGEQGTSFARPRTGGDLPPRIQAASGLLAEQAAQIEAELEAAPGRPTEGMTRCASGIGTLPGAAEAGLDDMAIMHCWVPGD